MGQSAVHHFQAEVTQVLKLVIQSLYSHKEVFLRELVSNASDALDKLRFRAISEPELLEGHGGLRIRLIPDPEHGTLTVWDNGVGMTADELQQALGTIAWSGSREFLERLAAAQSAAAGAERPELIGQFGVGFYSAFLVADTVEVVSRAAGTPDASRWRSEGKDTFSIEPAERAESGTSVILHLKQDQRGFLEDFRLRELVSRYSDYIAHPIELPSKPAPGGDPAQPQEAFVAVNRASALWQRPAKDVTQEQYDEFYKHLSHDWEPPLTQRHFHIEGTQMFVGLLFVPRRPPFDLFDPNERHGVRLHVKRVFVMDDCDELVPRWLRFVRGVVDSEDLPLNVSREVLQDSRGVKIIKKQLVSQTLDMLDDLAAERPDDYVTFWTSFGAVLKEALHFEPDQKDRVAKLLRYESSAREGWVSFDAYVQAMKEGQPAIYYATGTSKALLSGSPHLEALRKRGYEVLYMTDAVDSFAVAALDQYADKRLIDATTANLSLDDADAPPDAADTPLFGRIKAVLGDRIASVRASRRLTDSPACLVTQEGGVAPHIERMLRARQLEIPPNRRILEINAEHPIVVGLGALALREPESERVAEYVELLYDQALLAEGSPVDDPAKFARRVSELMVLALK
jgi:molecular chaperone HtpG